MVRLPRHQRALLTCKKCRAVALNGTVVAKIGTCSPRGTTPTTSQVTTFNFGTASENANTLISQGYCVNGTLYIYIYIYISGQYSHDTQDALVGVGDFEAQVR
jgi:enamine deaminase RidA (YjgF/YER057c/UK114 family)